MAFFNKILIEKKSHFSDGSNKLIINAGKRKVWEIKLFNMLRGYKDKTSTEKFKKLLETGYKNNFFDKEIFINLFNDLKIMFFEWNYNSAIKYYGEYLNFLVKTKNKDVIQNLDFLFFSSGHHMKTEEYNNIRESYIKLFEKYLLVKSSFFDKNWIKSKDSLGFTIKEHIISQAEHCDHKTMEFLMDVYNKNVPSKDMGFIENSLVKKMLNMISSQEVQH